MAETTVLPRRSAASVTTAQTSSTLRQPKTGATKIASSPPAADPVRPATSRRERATWRFSMGTRSPISAMASGNTPPAAAPDSTRRMESDSRSGAAAETSSVKASSTRQARMTRRLPMASPTGPSTGCTSA